MIWKSFLNRFQLLVFLVVAFLITCRSVPSQGLAILWTKQDADPYTHVAFSHDGTILALGRGDSNTSDFLNAANGDLIRSFTGQHNTTNDLVFTLDDQYLINGGGGGGSTIDLTLWRVATATRVIGPLGDHTNGTYSVNLSPNGQFLATSGRFDRDINIWRVPEMALALAISNDDPHSPGLPPRVKDCAFPADGQLVASSDIYGIKARRPSDGNVIYSADAGESPSIAFSPDGKLLAAAIPSEQAIRVWNASDGKPVRTIQIGGTFDFPEVTFSPDSRFIVTGYNTGTDAGALGFYNSQTGSRTFFENRSGAVVSLAFSPKGDRLSITQFDGQIVMYKILSVRF
jgi:WD40 repeat protein